MPKLKIPKSSPAIDMTPMVDLAFLLVTFFMLAASFRPSEPVTVTTPSSVSDKVIPENMIMVTVAEDGKVYFNLTGAEARKEALKNMMGLYKVSMTEEQVEKFSVMSTFGCTMKELPAYIDLSGDARKTFNTKGVPLDSLDNQLKNWISYSNVAALNSGQTAYNEAKRKGLSPEANDFKPKFIVRADGKALYKKAEEVIDVFRELNLNNLSFVTSSEFNPNN
ncbi:MAG: biopolymer transporter ExbD [Flavobacteriia bacterium]|nr:biopolymer transporter ExbD [Flavobacteriia bacterium]